MANEEKKKVINRKYENRADLEKLYVYVTIVNFGQSQNIINIFNLGGCSAQFIQVGNGTANKQIYDILGIEDNRKEVILSIVSRNQINSIKPELEAYFVASKRNKGIGFSIPMKSIIGVKLYQFLANKI